MNNFLKRVFGKVSPPEVSSQQSVHVTFVISDEFGTKEEREKVHNVMDTLEELLQSEHIGDCDGGGFGEYRGEIFMYGNSADKLFELARPILETLPFRPLEVTLRYGEVDDLEAPEKKQTI